MELGNYNENRHNALSALGELAQQQEEPPEEENAGPFSWGLLRALAGAEAEASPYDRNRPMSPDTGQMERMLNPEEKYQDEPSLDSQSLEESLRRQRGE